MADRMTKEQRHLCMSHIRGKDTRPELAVRKALFAAGFRYRVNDKSLPGKPDIVLKKYHTVIFINGCFWHGHDGCRLYVLPKTNVEFWKSKIYRNRRRDAAVTARLEARMWHVITVWECELEPKKRARTIEILCGQIRRNGELYAQEAAARRDARKAAKEERFRASERRRALEEEISSRYVIPLSVRKIAEKGEEYD